GRRAVDERRERRTESALGEDGRVDAARKLTELPERLVELALRGDDEFARGFGIAVEFRDGDPQLQRERDEALLRAVVEVPLEPAAFRVAGLDDARTRCRELLVGIRVRERLRDQIREVHKPALGALLERRLERRRHQGAPEPPADVNRSGDGRLDAGGAQPLAERPALTPVRAAPLRVAARAPAPEPAS